jgi:hypothetical protein
VPVCAWRGRQARAPRPDEPWVAAGEIADPAAVAARARAHYDGRCLARHAEVWRRLLEPR